MQPKASWGEWRRFVQEQACSCIPPIALLAEGAFLASLRDETPKHPYRRREFILGQAAREEVNLADECFALRLRCECGLECRYVGSPALIFGVEADHERFGQVIHAAMLDAVVDLVAEGVAPRVP